MIKTSNDQKITEEFDIVIVGAGNGGLAAAAELAMNGINVILLEQNNVPGGFATSFVRGRFEFEASLHELCDYGPENNKGGIRKLFKDKLHMDTDFIEVPEAYKVILTDPDYKLNVTMPFGLKNYLNKIEEVVPGSRGSVENFFKIAEEILNAFNYIARSHGNPDQKILVKKFSNFLKTASYSVEEVQEALNIPKRARDILNAYWCYLGIPTTRLNFTIFASMVYLYITRKAYIPKLRSHEYTTEMEKKIREFGGKIEYNTKVTKILVNEGNVVGVETSKGDKIKTNNVISNASPTLTYNKLIFPQSEVPEIAYKEVNARIHGLSGFVVYLGLNKSTEELGLKEYSYFIMDKMDTDHIYDSWSKLQVPTGQATICLNNAIPDCSPLGTCIISITTLFVPGAWERIKPQNYFKIKNEIAEGLIDHFEKATGTSIKNNIEEIEIATPMTYSRYTGTYNGIIYGYEP
ncbi:MAG: NAD(P)-binding protein, partial [Candidatus Lokiarchaeota archaeon]